MNDDLRRIDRRSHVGRIENVAQGALVVIAAVIRQLRSGERRIGIPG